MHVGVLIYTGAASHTYWGYKIPNFSSNVVYICYPEGNLIVIEKCYSWQSCCETGEKLMGNTTDIDVWMQELCIEASTTVQVYVSIPLYPLPKRWGIHTPCTPWRCRTCVNKWM